MGKKFGANADDVLPLFRLAKRFWACTPTVCTFMSDCSAWIGSPGHAPSANVPPFWHAAREQGMPLRLMDVGGGFPVSYDDDVPSIEEIAGPTLAAARVWLGPDVQVGLEPGRWMTNDAAVLVTEVIGKAMRGKEEWVYLDTGLYNGLISWAR